MRKDAVLHKFPKNEQRLQKCLHPVHLKQFSVKELRFLFVCNKHFDRRFVFVNAYPSLFTLDEMNNGEPLQNQFCGKKFSYINYI